MHKGLAHKLIMKQVLHTNDLYIDSFFYNFYLVFKVFRDNFLVFKDDGTSVAHNFNSTVQLQIVSLPKLTSPNA